MFYALANGTVRMYYTAVLPNQWGPYQIWKVMLSSRLSVMPRATATPSGVNRRVNQYKPVGMVCIYLLTLDILKLPTVPAEIIEPHARRYFEQGLLKPTVLKLLQRHYDVDMYGLRYVEILYCFAPQMII